MFLSCIKLNRSEQQNAAAEIVIYLFFEAI